MITVVFDPQAFVNAFKTFVDFIFTQVTTILTYFNNILGFISTSIITITNYINANNGIVSMFNNVYNAIPEVIRAIFILSLAFLFFFKLVRSL
jgi:phage-related minor tail protein